MVKTINLSKANSFDLTKKGGTFNLTKPEDTNAINFKQKPPKSNNPLDLNFTDPVEGMEKISIPLLPFDLYYTPDEVVDPQDCGKYPNSPWCGGNPISLLPIGIEPEIVIDGCNIGIGIQPVLFFIKLPQQQIVFKDKACVKIVVQEPPLPKDANYEEKAFVPPYDPVSQKIVVIYKDKLTSFSESEYTGNEDPYYFYKGSGNTTIEIFDVEFPYLGEVVFVDGIQKVGSTSPRAQKASARVRYRQTSIFNSNHTEPSNQAVTAEIFIDPSRNREDAGVTEGIQVWVNNYAVFEHIDRTIRNTQTLATYSGSDGYSIDQTMGHWTVLVKEINPGTQNYPPPPPLIKPPNPKIPPPGDMNCCPQILSLLQFLILRVNQLDEKVTNIDTCLGVEEFPISLPKRLIYPNAKGEEKIENVVQALGYQVRQIDKAVGYLPQKIKVLDTNSAQAGNQSVEVEIHSFADFAKETLQYLIDTEGDDDTLTNIAVRILYECGAIHQLSVQIAAMVDAAIEHLDFKESWKTVDVPFAYDPYAGQKGKKAGEGFGSSTNDPLPLTEEELEKLMPDLLKETLVKIKVLVNTQKRTLNDLMQELLRDARLAAAGVSENASVKRLVEIVESAQAALELQNTIARNNVRKALTSGDLRTRKKPKS